MPSTSNPNKIIYSKNVETIYLTNEKQLIDTMVVPKRVSIVIMAQAQIILPEDFLRASLLVEKKKCSKSK